MKHQNQCARKMIIMIDLCVSFMKENWDKRGGKGYDRGWDDWIASPTQRHEIEPTPRVGEG